MSEDQKSHPEQQSEIIFYSSPNGNVKVEVLFENETFWLSQKKMGELFGVDVRTVSEHLQNIFTTKELDIDSVIRNFRITAWDREKLQYTIL